MIQKLLASVPILDVVLWTPVLYGLNGALIQYVMRERIRHSNNNIVPLALFHCGPGLLVSLLLFRFGHQEAGFFFGLFFMLAPWMLTWGFTSQE
ncbi:MAG: hypothetical protein AB7C98_00580 [Acidithiobacillus sp.]